MQNLIRKSLALIIMVLATTLIHAQIKTLD